MATGSANFVSVYANGYAISGDGNTLTYNHRFDPITELPYNVGVQQAVVGQFNPALSLGGYVNSGVSGFTAHNLFAPSGNTAAADTQYNLLAAIGQNAVATNPQAAGASQYLGDPCIMMAGTLSGYTSPRDPKALFQYTATFVPRGIRAELGWLVVDTTAKGTQSYILDSGANAASGTVKGCLSMLQVYTPTGTAATGNIGVPTQPVAADTVVVNGVTYTWRAAIAAAGDVLIASTALGSAKNLYGAMTGGVGELGGAGTAYFAGTTPASTAALYTAPSGASNTIAITYKTTGTGGNAYTLAKTGTGGLTISGATLSGGVQGETLTGVMASSTTSGGAYTTFSTFTLDGTTRNSEIQTVSPTAGTTINRWIKYTATMSGSTMNIGMAVGFSRYWNS